LNAKKNSEVVSRYAELSERYHFNSNLPHFNLVIYDYKIREEEPYPDIVDVAGFGLPLTKNS
jgi:hypothetical protein